MELPSLSGDKFDDMYASLQWRSQSSAISDLGDCGTKLDVVRFSSLSRRSG